MNMRMMPPKIMATMAPTLMRVSQNSVSPKLPTSVTLTAHGVTLGKGLRIFGIEGEAVGDWGYFIEPLYEGGVTFPIGYTDGQGLYLPTSAMVPEGGYEASSAWEYGFPSNLAAGMEDPVKKAFEELKGRGIV